MMSHQCFENKMINKKITSLYSYVFCFHIKVRSITDNNIIIETASSVVAWLLLVPWLLFGCSLVTACCLLHSCCMLAPCLLHACSMLAPCMLHACSMLAYYLLTTCCLLAYCLLLMWMLFSFIINIIYYLLCAYIHIDPLKSVITNISALHTSYHIGCSISIFTITKLNCENRGSQKYYLLFILVT